MEDALLLTYGALDKWRNGHATNDTASFRRACAGNSNSRGPDNANRPECAAVFGIAVVADTVVRYPAVTDQPRK